MKSADITEMEWLAATLRATAERLERATALLRAAGDLEKLQARLAAIATPGANEGTERSSAGVGDRRRPGDEESPRRSPLGDDVRASALPVLSPASSTAADRPAEAVVRRELGSPASPVQASRAFAVFDHEPEARRKLPKNTAGGTRPPF